MIHVLFVQPYSSNLGGVDSVLLQLIAGLDRSRYRPFVLLTAPTAYVEKYEKLGCKVLFGSVAVFGKPTDFGYYFRNAAILLRSLRALRRIVREHRIDVIHSHKMEVIGPNLVGKLLGLATVQTVHELPHRPMAGYKFIGWLNHLLNDKVVVLCDRSKTMFRWFGRESRKLVKIYNGIEAPAPESNGAIPLREQLGLPPESRIALTVARLSKEKGLEYLIDAAAEVRKADPNVKFVVVGDITFGHEHAYKESLIAKVRQLGLEETVHLIGMRRDVPELLAQSDIFVLPSLSDTFPTVVLEAMGAGLPVITTDVGGTPEMVREGTGVLVPPFDGGALKEAVLRMLGTDYREMGRRGGELFRSEFSRERYVRNTTELYEQLLRAKKAGSVPMLSAE